MILVSSSGDHFDCFLAGDCPTKSCEDACLFAGIVGRRLASKAPVPTVVAVLEGTDVVERETEAGEAEERVSRPSSSSSLGLSSSEISTLDVCTVLMGE
jgi:hypothetical protein